MKLATAAQMRELDRRAIEEFLIPGLVLMENAGRGTVDFLLGELGAVTAKSVPIFVGPGNNGGDGLVIARYIHQLGGFPHIFYLTEPEGLTGEAGTNYQMVKKLQLPSQVVAETFSPDELLEVIKKLQQQAPLWAVIDALFGTGLTRELTGRFRDAVELINKIGRDLACPVVAVDLPSGLASDSGTILGACVQADLTVTYGLAKPAHYLTGTLQESRKGNLEHGRTRGNRVGPVRVIDIGIPPAVVEEAHLPGETLGPEVAQLLRPRALTSHKGSYGHLLILAGSLGKTGAAILSGLGALRGGAGLVTLAIPHDLNLIFQTALPEAMTIPLPHSTSRLGMADYELICEQLQGKEALVIGPGLGTADPTRKLVRRLYRELTIPLVVDADALNILALNGQDVSHAAGPRLLTPHPGEMARLLGITSKEVQHDRLAAAARFAALTAPGDLITILKGAGTICYRADGAWALNTTGNPGLAAGGMGDVLAGLLGSLLVQGYAPWDAARLGVYFHGLAADLLARNKPYGFLASEVAHALPDAFNISMLP